MKSIFDQQTRNELYNRIDSLTTDNKPQWGKMKVEQMVRHCAICEDYYFGNIPIERAFLGRIIGKFALKGILKSKDGLLIKNSKTKEAFLVTELVSNLEEEKKKWKKMIERYGDYKNDHFVHWFFGDMTKEQLGQFIYIHSNHHLVQFNA